MNAHPLAGAFSVETSARRIRHYRYAEERMMRTLGGWIALTPELPVKLLFGRHVWDCAQHADLWGRRLPELRSPAQQSEPSSPAFVRFMDLLDGRERREETIERVVGVYRVLKPHLVAVYEAHLAAANPVYEPPTRRILERCAGEERRHVAAGAEVLGRLLVDERRRQRAAEWERTLVAALGEAGGVAGDGESARVSPETGRGEAPGGLSAISAGLDPAVIEADLAPAIAGFGRALAAADRAALGALVTDAARGDVLSALAPLLGTAPGPPVAHARIGAYRMVKVRVEGAEGPAMLQVRWRRDAGGWLVASIEVSEAPRP